MTWSGLRSGYVRLATTLKQGTQLIFKVYLCDHLPQLEYSKQYMIELTTDLFIFNSAHYPFPLMKQTSSKLLPKIIYDQVHMGFTIESIHGYIPYQKK